LTRSKNLSKYSLRYTTARALDVGRVSNLRGGLLPPPVHCERESGPITNRPQLTKLPHKARSSAPLLLQEEVAYEHGVDAGGVEAAYGIARVQTSGSPKRLKLVLYSTGSPVAFPAAWSSFQLERVLVAIYGVDAHQVVGQDGSGEFVAVLGLDAADGGEEARVGPHVEIPVA